MITVLHPISKEELIAAFHDIEARHWIENTQRTTNDGAAGNMLEDLLGIPENNLPIPNAAEWELKTHRDTTTSLLTLFHQEPSPLALKVVAGFLTPRYGWPHRLAGRTYPADEMSFRATLCAGRSTRGFTVVVDDVERKVCVAFCPDEVREQDRHWLQQVGGRVADLHSLEITPYWGFDDLFSRARTKLRNCFFVWAEVKREKGKTYFHFYKVLMLRNLQKDKFLNAIRQGLIYIDFDARTGHNHGTKFRIMPQTIPTIYEECRVVLDRPKLGNK